jgi:hypothetical protein
MLYRYYAKSTKHKLTTGIVDKVKQIDHCLTYQKTLAESDIECLPIGWLKCIKIPDCFRSEQGAKMLFLHRSYLFICRK